MDTEMKLARATEFTFYPEGAETDELNGKHFRVTVTKRGKDKWAVLFADQCWNGKKWIHERIASGSGDKIVKTIRFDLDTALDFAENVVETVECNGYTYSGLQEKFKELNLA